MTTEPITIDTGTDQLLCEIRDGVALITLNRPEARNAMSPQLTPALSRMIQERGEDPRVGALLITGAGTAFCAGGDVKGMGDNSSQKSLSAEERAAGMIERHRRLTGALIGVRKPTIAALPGAAAGAGLAIALACGQDPEAVPRLPVKGGAAASFVFRSFDEQLPPAPREQGLRWLAQRHPEALLLRFERQGASLARELKWLGSHRYAVLHLDGADEADLHRRFVEACEQLGWPAQI